MHAYCL